MSSDRIVLKDFDTIFVTGHVTVPFCISWSDDNKIALLMDDGVQVFELYPTPLSDQMTITFLRSWIPASNQILFQNALVENKSNCFVWQLKRKEVYEMAIDSTLSTLIEKSSISSFVTQCCFSPLINNESYLTCLTNNGVLQIYKYDMQKWKPIADVSDLWIKYCGARDGLENMDFDLLKSKIFQLKIVAMTWYEKPGLLFATGHEDGSVCLWNAEVRDGALTMKVNRHFRIEGKPCCLAMCSTNRSSYHLLLIGTLCGAVKCVTCKFAENDGSDETEIAIEKQTELWRYSDLIKPAMIRTKRVDDEVHTFVVKNHVILIQRIATEADGEARVARTDWHEFRAPITSFESYGNDHVIGTRNHEFYRLAVDRTGVRVERDAELPLKPRHLSCFHCYGAAISKNKAIWIAVSTARVNYEAKTMKDTVHLLVFTPTVKFYGSLSDRTCLGLIRRIAEKHAETRLTEISDLLELKKCELLADSSNYADDEIVDRNVSALGCKIAIWEAKLKIFTQSAEMQNVVAECENYLALRWCEEMISRYSENRNRLSPTRKRSLEMMEAFLKKRESDSLTENACAICGEIVPVDNVRVSSCSNSHVFPRCCLSLLPCDSVPYAFCRLCDSTVLLEFISDNDYRCLYCDGLLVPDTRFKMNMGE